MNFYLIDKVIEIKVGKSASGIKCWSLDNQIFDSHFPGTVGIEVANSNPCKHKINQEVLSSN